MEKGKNRHMVKCLIILSVGVILSGCEGTYRLHKYYKYPNSLTAVSMGGTYAGMVNEYETLDECMKAKEEVERNDEKIGYTNSRFECKEN